MQPMPVKGPNMRKRWIIISSFCIIFLSLVVYIVTRPPIKRELVLYQANRSYDKGNYARAIEKYKKLIEFDPSDSSNQYNLGVAYIYNNQPDQARAQVQKLRDLGKDEYQEYAKILEDLIQAATEQKEQKKK